MENSLWKNYCLYDSASPHFWRGFIRGRMGPGPVWQARKWWMSVFLSKSASEDPSGASTEIQFQDSLDHIRNAMATWCKSSVWCKFSLIIQFYLQNVDCLTGKPFALCSHITNIICTVLEHIGKHKVLFFLRVYNYFDRNVFECSVFYQISFVWQCGSEQMKY